MIVPVNLTITPDLKAIIDEKTALNRTVADFKAMGVVPQKRLPTMRKPFYSAWKPVRGVFEYYLGSE